MKRKKEKDIFILEINVFFYIMLPIHFGEITACISVV